MADNTLLNVGTGGDTIASDDIAGVKFQRVKLIHGNDGVNDGDVSTTNPLPTAVFDGADLAINSLSAGTGANGLLMAQGATNFFVSTANSSTAQLAAAATFNGTIESVLSAPYASIIIDTDQTGTLVVKQYITSSAATQIINTTFNIPAKASGSCFGRSFPINGNFFSISYTNTGGSATTTLNINVAYGNIDATTQLLNLPTSLNEVNGSALSLGQVAMASSLPVVLASNQSSIPVAATLQAGSAIAGKFGIDQTTPGTTNLVALTAETTKVIGTVNPPAITKATQSANGFTTQDLKDAGRSARTITLDSFAVAATTETLNTMSYSTDNGTLTTGTSYTVTTAKRFRVQAISASLHTIAGNTTAVTVIVRIRVNNAGAAIVSSPVQLVIPIAGIAAANQSVGPDIIPIPDGWEFVAGAGIGVTTTCAGFVATTAAPKVDISIIGYEY